MDRTSRQKLGVKKWLLNNGKGLLKYCTGFGKTRTSMMIIKSLIKSNNSATILISVPTSVLKDQWTKVLIENNLFGNCKVEIINTIVKHNWDVNLLIVDEIHASLSESFFKIYDSVKYEMILGLTGTLERLDGKESLLKTICPVIDEVTVEEAMKNGWVAEFKEYKLLIDVDLSEYKELDKKFNSYFAYFNFDFKLAMSCATDVRFRNNYAKRMGANSKEVTGIAINWMKLMKKRKDFITSHEKKIEIANKILDKRMDKKCVTFSSTIKNAEKIKYGASLHSKQTKKKNKITLEEFNNLKTGVLNTSKAIDVGGDIEGLSVAVILSQNSSSIQKNQRIGRAIRWEPNKLAEIFTIVIRGTVEEYWYNNSSGSNYITITEDQLDSILNYEEIEVRKRENIKNLKYRF